MNYQCCYCSIPLNYESRRGTHPRRYTIEHIVPRSLGGASKKENLTPCCATCNELRSSKDLNVFKADVMAIVSHPVLSAYDLAQMPANIDKMIAYVKANHSRLVLPKIEPNTNEYVVGSLARYEHRFYF